MLEFDKVWVGYKDLTVIQDVSFRVGEGEVVSLVGSNGAGKTTILRTIAGLLTPTRSRPKLLMLDEPSLGIMPKLVAEIFRSIEGIRKKGITVLLVEQNVFEALEVCDRAARPTSARAGSARSARALLRAAAVGPDGVILVRPVPSAR